MIRETISKRPLVLLVALLLPILVIGGGWYQLRKASGLSEDAAQFERELARREPEVIIFGSSLANRGVDLPVLARSLGLQENKVMLMQLPHSSIAHWYAMLKNRVFARGHEPKLVLVVDAFTSMLNHDLLAELQPNVDRLVAELGPNEPVISSKVFHISNAEEFRQYFVRERASELRQSMLDAYRDAAIGLLYGRRGRPEETEKLIEAVNEEVFANDKMDYSLHNPSDDGVFAASRIVTTASGQFDLKRDGLLEDMAKLVEGRDTNIVYVRIPLPPSNADMDYVPPEIEQEAVTWIEELGQVYLDMRALDLDDSYFEDMRHLSKQGSQLFTTSLGRVLASMRALESGAGGRAIRGLEQPSSVVSSGAGLPVPTLAATSDPCVWSGDAGPWRGLDLSFLAEFGEVPLPLGIRDGEQVLHNPKADGCSGAVWIDGGRIYASGRSPGVAPEIVVDLSPPGEPAVRWVLPGSQTVYTFAEPWSLPENAFRVYVRGFAVGRKDLPITVTVGGEAFTLRNEGGRINGSGKVSAPTQPNWTMAIEVPREGPILLVHHLAIGAPPSTAFVLGDADTLNGVSVRVVGGRVEDTQLRAKYLTAVPQLPFTPRLRRGSRDEGAFQLDKLADLSDSQTRDDAKPNKCSPVVVLEDGQPLLGVHASCAEVFAQGKGRSCFAGDLMIFSASDDTDPMINGRTYTVVLSPRRICDVYAQKNSAFLRDSWWFYPGDIAEFTIPAEQTAAFRDGANVLEVEVMPHVAEVDEPMVFQVYAGDKLLLDKTFKPEGTLKRRRVAWAFDPPLPPKVGELRIRIENRSMRSFPLVTSITLAESYDVAGAGAAAPGEIDGSLPQRDLSARVREAGTSFVSRVGEPPALPEPKKGQTTGFGAFEAKVFPLWPVSDSYLEKLELPAVSPARLFIDGRQLTRVIDKKDFRNGCTDCFYHTGQSFVFYADEVSKHSSARVDLDPSFPMVLPDGTVAYWLYPGTTARFEVPDGWKGKEIEIVAEGAAFHQQKEEVGKGLFVRVGERTAPFVRGQAEGVVFASLTVDDRLKPVIELTSEQPNNFLLLRSLRVTDASGVAWLVRSTN
ncbi:MAG TPA: hypothetical protein PKA64_03050 [Myxococcota bacterium]|nr:hypothetical protein [Myxococcota bacterium]